MPSVVEAGENLGEFLITNVLLGKMNAKDCCTVSYWAKHAGVEGVVSELALHPSSPTGHFKRRFDEVIGAASFGSRTINLNVPGHSGATMGRVIHQARVFLSVFKSITIYTAYPQMKLPNTLNVGIHFVWVSGVHQTKSTIQPRGMRGQRPEAASRPWSLTREPTTWFGVPLGFHEAPDATWKWRGSFP